jgi:hypothetical protein
VAFHPARGPGGRPAVRRRARRLPRRHRGTAQRQAWGLDDDSWLFLCQFTDRGEEPGDDPFFLNFGYGSGFIFLSPDHREGRFLADSS